MTIKRIAVYCGSSMGADPAFAEMARSLAHEMVARGIDLVYGGGRLGLMGVMADTVLEAGGKVYGVIPAALVDKEVAHRGCTELHQVAGMHERKARMTELCDGFVVHGFWRGLDLFMDHVSDSGFLSQARREQLLHAHTPSEAIDRLDAAAAAATQGMVW